MSQYSRYTVSMIGDISLDGKEYISSKRASEDSNYSQDYIGQLARGGHIDARRVGGMWYISMSSLNEYKESTEALKSPAVKPQVQTQEPESLISFDGKDYISASRASKLTGYNQDYVGQLARGGKILSRQVGNRWYVDRDAILKHKEEKDSLLAAVQAESVGLYSARVIPAAHVAPRVEEKQPEDSIMNYHADEGDLIPAIAERDDYEFEVVSVDDDPKEVTEEAETVSEAKQYDIPIRVVPQQSTYQSPRQQPLYKSEEVRRPVLLPRQRNTIYLGTFAGLALTVVVVLSVGITSFKDGSVYATASSSRGISVTATNLSASAASAVNKLGDILESIVSPQLHYVRK